MIYKLIESYVLKLSPSDVDRFAKENGTTLTNDEINIFYNTIKKDWYTIIYEDPTPVFKEIKPKLNPQTYKKAEELFFYFKQKYQRFL